MTKRLFLSWCAFSRRIASLDEFFHYDETHYVPSPFLSKWLKPLGYALQTFRTARILATARPDEVWLHCPPTILPHLALAFRPFFGPYRIVADYHSGAISPKWNWIPGAIGAVNRCDLVLVHNADNLERAKALGIDPDRLVLLEDPPPQRMAEAAAQAVPVADAPRGPYALAPCSFNPDEPIRVLLDAARLAPEIPLFITGSKRRAEMLGFTADVPPNVTFTDYLPLDVFERLLLDAALVVGLTNVEGIQLSVANEALGADKALVLSDTRILRDMFGAAALFATNTPEDWAARLREGLARRTELEARSAALKIRRIADWRAPAEAVARRLAS
jgi:glycosyltransferase involved in cell wall biosynthesis